MTTSNRCASPTRTPLVGEDILELSTIVAARIVRAVMPAIQNLRDMFHQSLEETEPASGGTCPCWFAEHANRQ